jgi:hypothetical protein
MSLPKPYSPRVVLADLRAFFAERSRHQLAAAALALIIPIGIITMFAVDMRDAGTPPPQIIYVKSWNANRTDAEIKADQQKAQAEKEAFQRERQRQFKKLEAQLGMDD